MAHQPALPFAQTFPRLTFQFGEHNAVAVKRLTEWVSGADRHRPMALCGLDGSGKSAVAKHLVAHVRGRHLLPDQNGDYEQVSPDQLIVLDDAQNASGLTLFAMFNRALTAGHPLLMVGRGRPLDWGGKFSDPAPDLLSRLSSVASVDIDAPEAADIAKAVRKLLGVAGIKVPSAELDRLIETDLRRRFDAAEFLAHAIISRAYSDGLTGKGLLQAAVKDIPDFKL